MSTENQHLTMQSRRDFLINSSMASIAFLITPAASISKAAFGKPDSKFFGVQIGVITYSYRSMPANAEQLLKFIIDSGISAVELMGDVVEAYAGKPVSAFTRSAATGGQHPQLTNEQREQMAAYQKTVAEWRSKVSMQKFEELKRMYNKAGVDIYGFKPNALGANNTDAEIEYALRAAKALGARSVTVELPTDAAQSKRLGDLASKHKVYIGYHAHTQATDTAWDTALSQSPYNSMNLDCGHYIAAGGNNTKASLLALIQSKHDRITTMHIKDRKSKANGGDNVSWGQGDTPVAEILTLLKEKKYGIPATIELEYDIPAGSDAVKETKKCLEFCRKALGA